MIAKTLNATPGKALEVGIYLSHDPKWHTYWKATGDTGLPTKIKWTLPEGWEAQDIRWPVPKVFRLGDLVNYGYENQVLLPVRIQVPATAKTGEDVTLEAKVSWLMCEEQCVPGGADLSLTLPVSGVPEPADQSYLFEQADKNYPAEAVVTSAKYDPQSRLIEISFKDNQPADNFYVFAEGQETIVYSAEQSIAPTADGYSIFLQGTEFIKPGETFAGLLTSSSGPTSWARSFSAVLTEGKVERPAPQDQFRQTGLVLALGLAFLGGLILNLMPCVFPVLSLKILGLVENRGKRSLAPYGMGFLVGVLCSMTILAGLLMLLKATGASIGWGFQLQSPWFVAGLGLLFVAISANLLGMYEFALPALGIGRQSSTTEASPFKESFATGILAVIVASPCTAPFMGAALGFALTAPAAESFLVFICLGLGMALPWTVLTLFPVLTRWLPKPGNWMIIFKKIMALPMLLTAVWLFWILSQQTGSVAFWTAVASAVLLAASLYLLGKAQFGLDKLRKISLAAFIGSLALYGAGCSVLADAGKVEIKAPNAWSRQAVEEALKSGRPVFVDFTASWCLTCQANKLTVLRTEEIQKAFSKNDFVVMEADWTNYNPEITKALEHFGRSGVPLYVMYKPNGEAQILPELLTPSIVLKAVEETVK